MPQGAHFHSMAVSLVDLVEVAPPPVLLVSICWIVPAVDESAVLSLNDASNLKPLLAFHLTSVTLLIFELLNLAVYVSFSLVHALLVARQHQGVSTPDVREQWCNPVCLILISVRQFSDLHIEYSIIGRYFLPLIVLQYIIDIGLVQLAQYASSERLRFPWG